jgi:folate-dependent phosphoribosylglycinamide formyltransferase PurN
MKLIPIFDPEKNPGPMKVAAFMSGSGTNIIKLIEREKNLTDKNNTPSFRVVFIFSDRSDGKCNGERIAYKNGIPYFSYDIRAFHKKRGIKRTALTPEGLAARREFDNVPARLIKAFEIDIIALGGYMSYTTLDRCVNVHPGDLSILNNDGKRKYVGDHAVRDAILDGEKSLRASTLWTDQGVDTGPLLMVSEPLDVKLPEPLGQLKKDEKRLMEVVDQHQERLKEIGDWKIFPKTIEMIAEGRVAFDEQMNIYVDGKPVHGGYRDEKHEFKIQD